MYTYIPTSDKMSSGCDLVGYVLLLSPEAGVMTLLLLLLPLLLLALDDDDGGW